MDPATLNTVIQAGSFGLIVVLAGWLLWYGLPSAMKTHEVAIGKLTAAHETTIGNMLATFERECIRRDARCDLELARRDTLLDRLSQSITDLAEEIRVHS